MRELEEPGKRRPSQTSQEYFAQQTIITDIQCHCLIVVEHVIIKVIRAIEHGKSWHDKLAGAARN